MYITRSVGQLTAFFSKKLKYLFFLSYFTSIPGWGAKISAQKATKLNKIAIACQADILQEYIVLVSRPMKSGD